LPSPCRASTSASFTGAPVFAASSIASISATVTTPSAASGFGAVPRARQRAKYSM
jgi:hypothetical protein